MASQALSLAVALIFVASLVGYLSMHNPGGPATAPDAKSSAKPTALTSSSVPTPHSTSEQTIQPTSQSSCMVPPSGKSNRTVTITAQFPPCGCALADSNSNGWLYVSTSAKVGDNVCISAGLSNSDTVGFSVTNAAGVVVYSLSLCTHSHAPGAPSRPGISCTTYWDTTNPDPQGRPIGPGTYLLTASYFRGSATLLAANFTLR